jgi:hypothetical protein
MIRLVGAIPTDLSDADAAVQGQLDDRSGSSGRIVDDAR